MTASPTLAHTGDRLRTGSVIWSSPNRSNCIWGPRFRNHGAFQTKIATVSIVRRWSGCYRLALAAHRAIGNPRGVILSMLFWQTGEDAEKYLDFSGPRCAP